MNEEIKTFIKENVKLPILCETLNSIFFKYKDALMLQVMNNCQYFHLYVLDTQSPISKIEYIEEHEFNSYYKIILEIMELKNNSIMKDKIGN